MTVADIQAFLEDQSGSLAYYRAPDHAGVTKSAAEMIADAFGCLRGQPAGRARHAAEGAESA